MSREVRDTDYSKRRDRKFIEQSIYHSFDIAGGNWLRVGLGPEIAELLCECYRRIKAIKDNVRPKRRVSISIIEPVAEFFTCSRAVQLPLDLFSLRVVKVFLLYKRMFTRDNELSVRWIGESTISCTCG